MQGLSPISLANLQSCGVPDARGGLTICIGCGLLFVAMGLYIGFIGSMGFTGFARLIWASNVTVDVQVPA